MTQIHKNQRGFTLYFLVILMFILMLIIRFFLPLLVVALIGFTELVAVSQLQLIKIAQTRYADNDLNNNGVYDYAKSVTDLQNHNLLTAVSNGKSLLSPAIGDDDEVFNYKIKTSKNDTKYVVTAKPKGKEKYKKASHQFRISNDKAVTCAQLPAKRGRKIKWSTDITKCRSKTPKKERRYVKKEQLRLEKNLKQLFCKVLPSEHRDELMSILQNKISDTNLHNTILNGLDVNGDGQLSIDELDLDSTELATIAWTLWNLITRDGDISWNQDVETGNLMLSFLQDHVFTTTFKDTELRAEVEPLAISKVNGSKLVKKIKKLLSGC